MLTAADRRRLAVAARRAETEQPGWSDTRPTVSVEYVYAEQIGECWDETDFYQEYGVIPLSVAQAREFTPEEQVLDYFALWAPGDHDGEPLIEWSRET